MTSYCGIVIGESRSLELERKVGGKMHPQSSIAPKSIVEKYREGTVKRTLRRE